MGWLLSEGESEPDLVQVQCPSSSDYAQAILQEEQYLAEARKLQVPPCVVACLALAAQSLRHQACAAHRYKGPPLLHGRNFYALLDETDSYIHAQGSAR